MLDLKEQIKDFKPVDLSGLSSEDALYTESMRIAFTLYNKALKEINEGYRDLAKNSLRKAVAHYPEFGDAMIVLGICTFVNGDRIGAVRIFNAIKKPDDRKKGMEVLDRLAAAPDYIPPRTPTSPAPEIKPVQPIYEKPIFGKYSEPVNPATATSHTVQTDFIPKEIRPASRSKDEENNSRTRGVRSQYTGSHRQELMRKEQSDLPDAKPYIRPGIKQEMVRPNAESDPVPEKSAKAVEPVEMPLELDQTNTGSLLGNNKVLAIIFVILAAFAILAGAAWMNATARSRKLQSDLDKRPTETTAAWIYFNS